MTALIEYSANFIEAGTVIKCGYDKECDEEAPYYIETVALTDEAGMHDTDFHRSLESMLLSTVYDAIWEIRSKKDLPAEIRDLVDSIDKNRNIKLSLT